MAHTHFSAKFVQPSVL